MDTVQYYSETLRRILSYYEGGPHVWWAAFGICFLIILIAVLYGYKKDISIIKRKKNQKKKSSKKIADNLEKRLKIYVVLGIVSTLILVIFCAVGYIAYTARIQKMNTDIENGSFVELVGEIYIKPYRLKYGSSKNLGVISGTDLKIYDMNNENGLYAKYTPISRGKYYGTIIYGENSKTVVYWDVERIS